MKKKFDGYTVDFTKINQTTRSDGLIETQCAIMGNIEIGIEIDPLTFRGDWLCKAIFKDESHKYRLLNVENHIFDVTINGVPTERNLVTAVWRKIN